MTDKWLKFPTKDDIYKTLVNNDVKILDLSNYRITTIYSDVFDGLSNLRYLDLDNNRITTIESNAFDGLINLQWLHLSNNQITTIESNTFDGLSNLQRLYLNGNQITTIESNAFDGLSNLQCLDLDDKFKDMASQVLESKRQLREWIEQRNILTELALGLYSKDLPVLVVLEIAEHLIDNKFNSRLQSAWNTAKIVKHCV